MLELFLSALEEQLGLLVSPPLAPIARMNIISLEITRLTHADKLPPAPVLPEQKCTLCKGSGWLRFQLGYGKCYHCNGTGISNRSAGG